MATGPRYVVSYRRKRQGRTNYLKRKNLLKSFKPRLVVRKSNYQLIVQVVSYNPDGDKVLKTYLSSKELKKLGWNFSYKSIPALYLFGLYVGKELTKNKYEVVVDLGMSNKTKGCVLFSFLKGIVDSKYDLNVDESMFPSDEQISGKVIASYMDKNKDNFKLYKKSSKDYLKLIDDIKNKLMK